MQLVVYGFPQEKRGLGRRRTPLEYVDSTSPRSVCAYALARDSTGEEGYQRRHTPLQYLASRSVCCACAVEAEGFPRKSREAWNGASWSLHTTAPRCTRVVVFVACPSRGPEIPSTRWEMGGARKWRVRERRESAYHSTPGASWVHRVVVSAACASGPGVFPTRGGGGLGKMA